VVVVAFFKGRFAISNPILSDIFKHHHLREGTCTRKSSVVLYRNQTETKMRSLNSVVVALALGASDAFVPISPRLANRPVVDLSVKSPATVLQAQKQSPMQAFVASSLGLAIALQPLIAMPPDAFAAAPSAAGLGVETTKVSTKPDAKEKPAAEKAAPAKRTRPTAKPAATKTAAKNAPAPAPAAPAPAPPPPPPPAPPTAYELKQQATAAAVAAEKQKLATALKTTNAVKASQPPPPAVVKKNVAPSPTAPGAAATKAKKVAEPPKQLSVEELEARVTSSKATAKADALASVAAAKDVTTAKAQVAAAKKAVEKANDVAAVKAASAEKAKAENELKLATEKAKTASTKVGLE